MIERAAADRIAVLVTLALAGLTVSLFLSANFAWVFSLLLAGAVSIGTDNLVRTHPKVHLHELGYTLTFDILPALVVLGSGLFLRLVAGTGWQIAGLIASAVALTVVLVAEYRTIDTYDLRYGMARFALNITTYAAAFALYSAIYSPKVRSLQSATAVAAVTVFLSLELFRETEQDAWRTWLHSLVVGFVLGQATWGLNYWPLGGFMGGTVLLLIFYLVSGVVQSHLAGKLTRRLALEYTGVSGAGALLLFSSRFWLG